MPCPALGYPPPSSRTPAGTGDSHTVSCLQVEPWRCPPALSSVQSPLLLCPKGSKNIFFLQKLGAIKLSFLFLYLLWPRHRGNLELREGGLAALCCREAYGQPLLWLWERRDSSALGEGCSETAEGGGSTVKLIIRWQKWSLQAVLIHHV